MSSLGCDVPNITLVDQTKFFYQAVEKVKCETMLLRAVIVLAECENSLDNHKVLLFCIYGHPCRFRSQNTFALSIVKEMGIDCTVHTSSLTD